MSFLPHHSSDVAERCILVVDDNRMDLHYLKKVIASAGYTVLAAAHPREALQLFHARQIDLVVADYVMPEMDGLEMIAEMRRHPQGKSLPIIVCTSSSDQGIAEAAESLQVIAFMVKPVRRQTILDTISNIFAQNDYPSAV